MTGRRSISNLTPPFFPTDIHFSFGSRRYYRNSIEIFKLKVEGHTDYVGSVPYNEKLALARANEVRSFLAKYGAGAGQISVSGQGKRVPEVPNTTKEGRFINRRVVLTLTDANGNIIAAGGGPEVANALDERLKKLEDCCNAVLKKLDKLDDILAAIRDLKAENDRLKVDVANLKNQKPPEIHIPTPPPPTPVRRDRQGCGRRAGRPQQTLRDGRESNLRTRNVWWTELHGQWPLLRAL